MFQEKASAGNEGDKCNVYTTTAVLQHSSDLPLLDVYPALECFFAVVCVFPDYVAKNKREAR